MRKKRAEEKKAKENNKGMMAKTPRKRRRMGNIIRNAEMEKFVDEFNRLNHNGTMSGKEFIDQKFRKEHIKIPLSSFNICLQKRKVKAENDPSGDSKMKVVKTPRKRRRMGNIIRNAEMEKFVDEFNR